MLQRLTDIKVQIEGPLPVIETPEEISAIEMLLTTEIDRDHDLYAITLRDDLREIGTQLTTIEELSALKHSIVKYGMTRSLLSFANYNNVLSTAIATIPSMESLTSDRSVKNSQDVVAALEAAISERLEIFWKTFKARLANFFNHFKRNEEHLHKYVVRMQVLSKMMDDGRIFDTDKAKKHMLSGYPYDHLVEQLESVHRVVDVSEKLLDPNLPFTLEAFNGWHEKMRTAIESVSEITHIHVTSNGKLGTIDANRTKKSMYEFGYDSIDKFHKLLPLLASVFKSCKKILDTASRINDIHWDTYSTDGRGNMYANASMRYVREACEFIMEAMYHLYGWIEEVGTAAYTAMKDIFSCTTKAV